MLQVGDKVVYPMHGAGEIAGIEEHDVMGQGQMKSYYVMKMPIGDVKIMLPTDNIDGVGLRQVSPPEMLKKIEGVLKDPPVKATGSWK